MDPKEVMDGVAGKVRDEFEEARRILSFEDYLELFQESPTLLARSAPQYLADMIEHFGTREVETARGDERRHTLFDLGFRGGVGRVHSQETVQEKIYRLARAFGNAGHAEKLILLTGPNGSGKSVIVEAIFRGLEYYSTLPEGAKYRFNWVFPRESVISEGLGFTPKHQDPDARHSYAHLQGEEVAARLICELKDHPLFLVPLPERSRFLEQAIGEPRDERGRSLERVLTGELCQKCKMIYEGLLTGYQGDWLRVMQHVQVERYFISQRFRSGAVTILPMGSVDAQEQQITADLSIQSLPPVLQNLKLFEPLGDLVDANGGVVEYGDFLKRPMDFNKYLLSAVEKGTISLPNTLAHLDLVMCGTSNEKHLDAFKATPEFTSFKGRIELVAVPYILEYEREAELYRDMLGAATAELHVAPHTFEMAALWAVLTRLLRPDWDPFEGPQKELVKSLTPLDKAMLYQHLKAPERLEREDRQLLLAIAGDLRTQYRDSPIYEGRFGASAREMHMVLTQAAYDSGGACLTPTLLFGSIGDLIKDKTVYDFLKLKKSEGYHDPEGFIDRVSEVCAGRVLGEFQDAMQLISQGEYDRQFDEYFLHVIAFNKNESVRSPQTGEMLPPSESVMGAIEELLSFEEPRETFRQNLVARIGAYAIDHPDEELNYRTLFPDLLRAVKKSFFDERKDKVRGLIKDVLLSDTDEFDRLPDARRDLVKTALGNLVGSGYCDVCARDAASFLHTHFPGE